MIASLARPGGNFTGLQNYEASITGKWLAMLKEIEPRLTRAGLVGDSQSTDFGYFLRASEAVAPSLVIDIVPLGVENAADIERAIDFLRAWRTAAWWFRRVARPSCILPDQASAFVKEDVRMITPPTRAALPVFTDEDLQAARRRDDRRPRSPRAVAT